MGRKVYAIAGHWGYVQTDPMGITSFRYNEESGELEPLETVREDIISGQMCIDETRGMIYVVNEIGHIRGDLGGGGYVHAFRIDPETGKLEHVSERRTLSPEPCYVTLDASGAYLLVSHNSDPYHVTKIQKKENGEFTSETVYDDTALDLFRVNEDGSLGELCDVSIMPCCGAADPRSESYVHPVSGHIMHIHVISRLHSVTCNADSSLYAVCDRGMNRVYTYQLDRAEGKLIQKHFISEYEGKKEDALSPRYSVFHPRLPYLYVNSERVPVVLVYRWDPEGNLTRLQRISAVFDPASVTSGCNDILMHPDGTFLYCTCMPRTISVFAIRDDGLLDLKYNIDCGGEYPRTICFSPDGRYLFSGNNHSGTITSFRVEKDGFLTDTGKRFPSVHTSVLRFIRTDANE